MDTINLVNDCNHHLDCISSRIDLLPDSIKKTILEVKLNELRFLFNKIIDEENYNDQ